MHDATLERISTGTGKVYEHTYEELLQYDFGVKTGEKFRGMRILKFEEILRKFACHVVMNIHIKTVNNDVPYDETLLQKIIDLIEKYDCAGHVYFMSGNDHVLAQLQRMAPHICRCVGAGKDPWGMVERAEKFGCRKIQLFMDKYNQSMIDRAKEKGIILNYCGTDDPAAAKSFLDMGVDVILTNDYQCVADAVREWNKQK